MSTLVFVLSAVCLHAADKYSEITARVEALNASPVAHVIQLGKSGKGHPIYALLLSDSTTARPAGTRVLVMGGQHGDEVSPIYAMLDLAEDMASDRNGEFAAMLRDVTLVIVPVVNPDGFVAKRRVNSSTADLNRSWNPANQPEVRSVQALVDSFKPQVVLDLHEWMDHNPVHTNCVEVAGFGSGPQRKLARMLSAFARHETAKRAGVSSGVRAVYYRKEADRRLAHRHFSNQGMCSMLIETASDQPRAVRMRVYREFVIATVRMLSTSTDPRIAAQVAAVDHSLGAPDPKFARICAPPRVAVAGVGDISCWIVIAAASIYIVMRSLGSRNRRGSETLVDLGRLSGGHAPAYRMPLTEMVRANIPLHERVALIQQQRVRPSDRGKAKAAL